MEKIRGNPSFEGPSKDELDDYLQKSHKSINLMKKGKSPLFFKPKRNTSIKVIGFVFLLVVSSGLLIVIPLLSILPLNEDVNSNNSHQASSMSTTSSITITTTSISSSELEYDLLVSIKQVTDLINTMITSDGLIVHPIIVNGTINTSETISVIELLDLVWYLGQYKENTNLWELGRDLMFKNYVFWNDTSLLNENISVKLKALRSMLAYPSNEIILSSLDHETFNNLCTHLWNDVLAAFDNDTHTISTENTSTRYTEENIVFIDILTKTRDFSYLFDIYQIINIAEGMLDTIDVLTDNMGGISNSFLANKSWIAPLYLCSQQGSLILALEKLKMILTQDDRIDLIESRLHDFIHKKLINQNWSFSKSFNSSNDQQSEEIVLIDQCFIIRVNVLFEYLNFASFTIKGVKEWFSASNGGYYSTKTDNQTQFLLDQILVLLTLQELFELVKTPDDDIKASGFGVIVMLSVLLIIPLKRKIMKRKSK